MDDQNNTIGEICAGIGGFSVGFEQAGWKTVWQIEIDDINRAVLADRFPAARQCKDLRDWRSFKLPPVQCIAFGFPCQDISVSGNVRHDKTRSGLAGHRSGLFFEIMEIVRALRPPWLVIENVPGLLHSNDCRDFQAVIAELAQCGYVGFARVLDAQYFGVPQKRRRLFLVAGFGKAPSSEFMADAGTVESIPCSISPEQIARPADAWAGYTLMAPDKHKRQNSRISLGNELLVAHADGWDQMVERAREVEIYGFRCGLDATDAEQAYAAGNAVPPPIAKWIAGILNRS
jgi:DNA (cytosine-5)-methyltransferase 1